jgi:hypothetical protein
MPPLFQEEQSQDQKAKPKQPPPVESPPQSEVPPQPPTVNPGSTNVVSWPKVIVTILIVSVATAAIAGAYWYFVLSKDSSDNEFTGPVKVATPSAKKATSSAEIATPSAKVDTTGWKTYTNQQYKFSFKRPKEWKLMKSDQRLIFFKKDNYQLRFFLVDPGIVEQSTEIEVLTVGGNEVSFLFWNYKFEFNTGEKIIPERLAAHSAYGVSPGIKVLDAPGSFVSVLFDAPKNSFNQGWLEAKTIISTIKFLD